MLQKKSLQIESEIDTYGNDPHDIQFIDDDRVVIANGGSGTNISIVDLTTGNLERSYPCELEGISCRHLIVSKDEIFVLSMVSVPNSRYLSHLLYPVDGKLVPFGNTFFAEDRLKTQLLSGVSTDDHIITTAPLMNAIHVWDKKSKQLIRVDDFELAAGVALTLDKSKYIVTSAFENEGMEYDASNTKLLTTNPGLRKLTGRHTLLAAI